MFCTEGDVERSALIAEGEIILVAFYSEVPGMVTGEDE